jgi:hypothetical protein
MINGWSEARHCWKNHICKPLGFESTNYDSISITVIGFVFFFITPEWFNNLLWKDVD